MKEDGYPVNQSQQIYEYEFFSEGPKGRIRKVIQFQSISDYSNLFEKVTFRIPTPVLTIC